MWYQIKRVKSETGARSCIEGLYFHFSTIFELELLQVRSLPATEKDGLGSPRCHSRYSNIQVKATPFSCVFFLGVRKMFPEELH